MNEVTNIEDIVSLLEWSDSTLQRKGNEVFIEFPNSDNFPISQPNVLKLPMTCDPNIDFNRTTTNTIRSLVTPHFRRVTSVAYHLTQYSWSKAGKSLGIVSCRKKADKPFTIIFQTDKQAESFCSTIETHQNH